MSKPPVTIITPVSDRPYTEKIYRLKVEQMRLFYGGEVQVVVVDDGREPFFKNGPPPDIEYHRRKTSLTPVFSFLGNLEMALEKARHDTIVIIEDDDWYSPAYLSQMMAWGKEFPEAWIWGESAAKYYNVVTRRFHIWSHSRHASLCQTAIRGRGIDAFRAVIEEASNFSVDTDLWKREDVSKVVLPGTTLSVGIKGLAPVNGLGVGHQLKFGAPDPKGWVLYRWVGQLAAKSYFKMAEQFKEDHNETNSETA